MLFATSLQSTLEIGRARTCRINSIIFIWWWWGGFFFATGCPKKVHFKPSSFAKFCLKQFRVKHVLAVREWFLMFFKQNCAKLGLKRTFFGTPCTVLDIGWWWWRMADNILYVMNVCDHYVDHGIVVDVLKTFMMSLLVIKVIVLWGDHFDLHVLLPDF